MPGPDPNGVWLKESENGTRRIVWDSWSHTNVTARRRRALAVLRNVARGGWLCRWCRSAVPLFRRSDALYCGESCRKKAARQRGRRAAEPAGPSLRGVRPR